MPRATRLKKNNRGPATVVCPWCQNPNKLFWPGKSINSHIACCPAYKEVLAQNNIPKDAEEEGAGSKDPGEELELEDREQGSVDENMEGGHLGVEEFGNVNVGHIGEHADDASMDILDPNTIEEPDVPINPLRKTNTRTSRLPSRYHDFSLAMGYSFLADPIHHQPTPSPKPMEDMQEVESGSPKASQESNPMEQDHSNENDYFISQPNEFSIYHIHQYHRPSREPKYGIDNLADSRNFDVAPSFSRSLEAIYGKVTPEGDPSSSPSSHSPSHVIGLSHEGDTDSLQESQDLECYPSVEVPSNGESHISKNEVAVGPFQNSTIFRLMDWALNVCRVAKGAGAKIIDCLVHEVILAPEFNREHLLGFRFRQQEQIMDAYQSGVPDIELPPPEEDASEDKVSQHPSQASTESVTPLLPFVASDEWHTGHVDIPVPCARYKCKEDDVKIFRVNDIYYRNPLDVIQSEFADTTFHSLHLKLFKEFFRPSPNADVERVYGEMERDVMKRVPNDNEHEVVIAALMDASDSTLLANFGTASLWPGYSVLGNLSHYIRLKPSMHALNAILFVPSLPDSFQDFYKEHFERLAPDSVLRHCKRELIMLIWGLLFLNPDFIVAYLYGILMHCADDVIRLIFPQLFTHTADYVEKVILASIKFLAECPCLLCLVKKSQISQLGTKADMRHHENKPREDSAFQRDRVEMSRTLMYEKGYSVNNQTMNELLSKWSGLPHRNPFSKLLSMIDDNYYKLFCNDLMHEAAGRWNDAFKHLCRCLYALAKELIQRLNERYWQVPTFGNGTIRQFKNNVSELKKFAFRDFEDLLQVHGVSTSCTIS
uniref:Uncharacterized protein n=1 Tax=Moniliophthora roreri TaxID=221103 RepID=A0A0W0FPN8_MONRR